MDASLEGLGQIVLVLQGGGALGAYQAGVYEALHEAGIEPDWVIGTSIGAINAGLITGNAASDRVDALKAFWERVRSPGFGMFGSGKADNGPWRTLERDASRMFSAWRVIAGGLGGFFAPNPLAFAGVGFPMAPEEAGYYSTRPLRRTLRELIDLDRINACAPRLTVGAANVATAQMRYFDSRNEPLSLDHIIASGSLPPAFPAVRIDGELYWDGGVLSNTPVEAVFDDNPRRNSIIFAIHMWRPDGAEPRSIWEVTNREKDLRYTSRVLSNIARQRDLHRLRHIISTLGKYLPPELADNPDVAAMRAWGCTTRMHVVRLLAPRLTNEDHLKDIDFTPEGIADRWHAGLMDMRDALARRPWLEDPDPMEGLILHEIGIGAAQGERPRNRNEGVEPAPAQRRRGSPAQPVRGASPVAEQAGEAAE
ncbi:patatin [Acuticoccus sediminis]|uniref:Patatin n=1 Tax=Acuticoccus sediminis TaxID=2184697 RepID=A0A8B2NR14_9HYPH|nr:patatin-like phospholipase family protein [Acuticoccus sediminis]RAH98465.1 patatin [Acuticoccus sediminis]